jgi:hypothetical protein
MSQTELVASFRQHSSFSTGPRCTPPTAYQGCLVNSIFMGRGAPGEHESSVARFDFWAKSKNRASGIQ